MQIFRPVKLVVLAAESKTGFGLDTFIVWFPMKCNPQNAVKGPWIVLEKSFYFIDLDLWEPCYQDNELFPCKVWQISEQPFWIWKSPLIVLIYKIVEVDKISWPHVTHASGLCMNSSHGKFDRYLNSHIRIMHELFAYKVLTDIWIAVLELREPPYRINI